MDKQDLIPLVQRVAELRGSHEKMTEDRELLKQKVKQTPEGKEYEANLEKCIELGEDLHQAEIELKEKAVALYEETKEKKPIDKVEIKIFKRLSYSVNEVLAWCRTLAPYLLILDKKGFEKKVNDLKEAGAPVEVTEEAKCTIGTDLSLYINTKEEVKTDG